MRALGHRDDAVIGFDRPAAFGGAARHQPLNLAVAILRPEQGADPVERQLHANRKSLQLRFAEILRVRVVHVRERRQINLEHVVIIIFLERPQYAGVAAGDDFDDFVRFFLVQFFLEILVTDPVAP